MSFIKVVREANGLLNKQRILRSANETDKKVFKYAYDKAITFGVTFDFIDWSTVKDDSSVMLFEILDSLANRTLTGNAARSVVEHHAETHGDLIKLICNKDLDCGVSYGIIESVFGKKLVNKFAVQLAKEIPLEKLKYPMLAQIKYDGVRVIAIKENGKVTFKTRNGKEFKCPIIEQQILSIPQTNKVDNFILDGEFVLNFAEANSVAARTSIAGRINSALHGGILVGKDVQFAIFDYMTVEHFNAQKCPWTYKMRMDDLRYQLYSQFDDTYDNMFIVPGKMVHDAIDANAYYESVSAEGFEGLILKSMNHIYTFKRSADWVKVKAIQSADLKCTAIIPGTGKYDGLIGALECSGIVKGKQIKVNVGSGLSDAQRNWVDSMFEGKIIEVKYNELIQDSKTGQWSLFLPRFVTVRGDLS